VYEYQLVLQLPEDCTLTGLDFEDEIAEAIGNAGFDQSKPHMVDGNSYGAGTIEFFIHTSDPHAAFELAKPLLASASLLGLVTAGFRKFTEDDYEVIWPAGYSGTFAP
jgi:hypothetical protein